jgi:creatinine amidohydrolase/Fe(II)-dependent formamide hydrolase-like protein
MSSDSRPRLITELTPNEVRQHLQRDRRLIVPLGACDQYGPHLPIGASTLVAEAFAQRLCEDFDVLRAPALPYGVNVPSERGFPGAASVHEKSLHAFLNDLLASWEDCGFGEFIVITVHDYDSHVEAVATVTGTSARVRVIEVLNIDLSEILTGGTGPEHGGEVLTSLLLFLYPEKVRMDRAVDYVPSDRSLSTLRRTPRIPADSAGSLGRPSVSTAEIGRRLFTHIYEKIRTRVFSVEL